MKQIALTDITLCESKTAPGHTLTFKERVELAKTLDKLKIDAIRLFPILSEKADTTAIRTIATVVKNSVLSMPAQFSRQGIDLAWNAISEAAHPELYIAVPASVVQMEYHYQTKPEKMLPKITAILAYAKTKTSQVHFGMEDATRADFTYLCQVIETAVDAGATTITLCDTAGKTLPQEFAALIEKLYASCDALQKVRLQVQCNDDLCMGAACAVSAIGAGADGIAVTSSALPAAPALQTMAQILRIKGEDCGFCAKVCITGLQCAFKQLELLTAGKRIDSASDTSDDSVELFETDDIATVAAAVRSLGYDLSDEDLSKVYDSFSVVAKQKTVGAKELEAIVATVALQVPPTYTLIGFVINSGTAITATAQVEMEKDGVRQRAVCAGHGPIDAAFLAIDTVLGHHYEVDDFQIQSVTEGSEAMGHALVRLRADGKLYSGAGISTDIIGASIRAYVNAVNKIAYEEANA